ncbi:hypothetical protein [Candidatus Uabimicrobium amorphum]|uniref:Uncharacterized protein n=1 Tax=Uabimicrobium amorphum TaxID=2596890 RepID=A0A5S9IHZ6_UABAM|nr:hypothetical protein [Candidatus Uabimicrobium amorphum]BBM82168.1 hypothetical protein UABAM_00511 [Candidatus Uabimicrobium amorphum]
MKNIKTNWVFNDLPGFRTVNDFATYYEFPYENLPPIPEDTDEDFSWIISQRERGMGGNLDGTIELAKQNDIELPQSLHVFIEKKLQKYMLSSTDYYFDSGEKVTRTQNPSGFLLHLIADSQWCYHWYLFVGDNGEHCVLGCVEPYGYEEYASVNQSVVNIEGSELELCSPSFFEFIYRFWIENEIWFSLAYTCNNILTPRMVEYLAHYAAVVTKQNLNTVQNRTIYEGCTFYLSDKLPALKGCIFQDCSFRDAQTEFEKLDNCRFIRCNFNKVIFHDSSPKFQGGIANSLVVQGNIYDLEWLDGLHEIEELRICHMNISSSRQVKLRTATTCIKSIVIDNVDISNVIFSDLNRSKPNGIKGLQKVTIINANVFAAHINQWNIAQIKHLHFKQVKLNPPVAKALLKSDNLEEMCFEETFYPEIHLLKQALPHCKIRQI